MYGILIVSMSYNVFKIVIFLLTKVCPASLSSAVVVWSFLSSLSIECRWCVVSRNVRCNFKYLCGKYYASQCLDDQQNSIKDIINKVNLLAGAWYYAYIFSDIENVVTKNVDSKYQISFLPYSNGLLVNDTSTKLNFSVMENNTDVPNLFTSLVIMDKNTGG